MIIKTYRQLVNTVEYQSSLFKHYKGLNEKHGSTIFATSNAKLEKLLTLNKDSELNVTIIKQLLKVETSKTFKDYAFYKSGVVESLLNKGYQLQFIYQKRQYMLTLKHNRMTLLIQDNDNMTIPVTLSKHGFKTSIEKPITNNDVLDIIKSLIDRLQD